MRYLLLSLVFLTGCASAPLIEYRAGSWTNQCYRGFEDDVASLAGKSAVDCGFLSFGTSDEDRVLIKNCARGAVRSDQPFKFGYHGLNVDSVICDVAVRTSNGELISFFVDTDVSGQMGEDGNHIFASTAKCKNIQFIRRIPFHPTAFFNLRHCIQAPEIFSTLPSQK
jgi:hypothetical protein